MNAMPMIERCMERQKLGTTPPPGIVKRFPEYIDGLVIDGQATDWTTLGFSSFLGAGFPFMCIKEE